MEEEVKQRKAFIIGGSAGSLKVILKILKALKSNLQIAVIIVIHRKNDPNSGLIDVLAQSSKLPVKEAEDKEFIQPGNIYLAPAGYHLLIERDFSFSLDDSEMINFSRPSIDVSFQTAAEAYAEGLSAVILSGANHDGTAGSRYVKLHQGSVIAQDPKEAETPFMPEEVIRNGLVDSICDTAGIIDLIKISDLRNIG